MTFIQPHKQLNFLNGIIVFGMGLAVVATFVLVATYNAVVNTSHNIATVKAEIDQVGAQNTALQNQEVSLLGSDNMSQVAAADGLVQDVNPQYVPVGNNQSITLR